MSYKLTITQKQTYLHAVVTGLNNRENVELYLDEMLRECIVRDCFRVLVEERLEGARLGATDVFLIVSDASNKARPVLQAFAYVDVNAEGDLMKFAETIATNRWLPVKVFSSVATPSTGCWRKVTEAPNQTLKRPFERSEYDHRPSMTYGQKQNKQTIWYCNYLAD